MVNRWIPPIGILAGSAITAYFAKSPFLFVLGLLVILYYLLFTSKIFTNQVTLNLTGDDVTQVQWVGYLENGHGIYSFQINKQYGLAVWISNSADTTKPALILVINHSQYGTALYQWDGTAIDYSSPLVQGKSFPTSKISSVGRETEAALVNVNVYPNAIWVYGATPSQMEGSNAPNPSSPLYLNPNSGPDYFILNYVNTSISGDLQGCYANIGFASVEQYDGTIITPSSLQPGSGGTTAVFLRSADKGMPNDVDPQPGQIAFDDSWKLDSDGTGIITFQLNFDNSTDFQSGLVVIASPWPGYQDAMVKPTGGTQYYFYFCKESHGAHDPPGESSPVPIGSNLCDLSTFCWEGFQIRRWTVSDSDSTLDCAGWGRAKSTIGDSLFQGWKRCYGGSCESGTCDSMAGSQCRILDRTSSFSGKSGCCDKTTTSVYAGYRQTMWAQDDNTYVTCYVEMASNTMSLGFIDTNGNQVNVISQSYSPDSDNPPQYWGFALVGLGDDSMGSFDCKHLHDYSGKHSRLTLTNIATSSINS